MQTPPSDVLEVTVQYIAQLCGIDLSTVKIDYSEDLGYEMLKLTTNKACVGKLIEKAIYENTGFSLSLNDFAYVTATLTFTRPLCKDPLA